MVSTGRFARRGRGDHVVHLRADTRVPEKSVPADSYDSSGTLERGTRGHFSAKRYIGANRYRPPIGCWHVGETDDVPPVWNVSYCRTRPLCWNVPRDDLRRMRGLRFSVVSSCNASGTLSSCAYIVNLFHVLFFEKCVYCVTCETIDSVAYRYE